MFALSASATDYDQEFFYTVPEKFSSIRALLENDNLDPQMREKLGATFSQSNDLMAFVDVTEGITGTATGCSLVTILAIDSEEARIDDMLASMVRRQSKRKPKPQVKSDAKD